MEKWVYWNVSVGLKWVPMSSNLKVEKRGPLKTSVSRKTAFVDNSSCVNLIVGWKVLTKSTNPWTSVVDISHSVKTSSMKRFQTVGQFNMEGVRFGFLFAGKHIF